MSTPQIAPSEFNFNMPSIKKTKKVTDKDKQKWVDKRPFFGGFGKETKNKQSSKKGQEESKVAVRAGGYNPISRETQRKKFENKNSQAESSGLLAAGIQLGSINATVPQRNSMGGTQYDGINQYPRLDVKKKKTTPGA